MIGLLLWLILGVVLNQWRTGAEREFIQACHDRVDHDLPSLDEIDVASLQRAPLSVRHWWTLLRLSLRRQADPILEEKRRRLHGRTAIAFGAMSATAPIALASTVYPDVAAGLAALFLGATFLAFRRRFARFTLAQQDSFWGFGFPQTG